MDTAPKTVYRIMLLDKRVHGRNHIVAVLNSSIQYSGSCQRTVRFERSEIILVDSYRKLL